MKDRMIRWVLGVTCVVMLHAMVLDMQGLPDQDAVRWFGLLSNCYEPDYEEGQDVSEKKHPLHPVSCKYGAIGMA